MLQEPWVALLALYRQIPALEAAEDLRALMVAGLGANPGEKGQKLKKYSDDLRLQAGLARTDAQVLDTLRPGLAPFAMLESEPGSIQRERERQAAAAERLESERRAAWEAQRRAKAES